MRAWCGYALHCPENVYLVLQSVSHMHSRLLAYASRYIELTHEEAEYFVSLFRHRKILKRQFLLQAGDICRYESFVVNGCLRAYFVEPSGSFHIVQFAVEDWWTSDLKSFMQQTPATLNIDALEPTDVLQIDKDSLDLLYQQIPQTERMFRMMLTNAFIAHQQRIIDNLCKPAAERYLAFIEKYRNISQRVPQAQIASYLGMTPEFLSQIRRNLMR
jgi:CRP-like cAMP-binding protein